MRRLGLLFTLLAALAGCGNARTRPPDIEHPDAPRVSREYAIANAGVSFTGPGNWQALPPAGTLVGGIRDKTATLAIWRYPRTEPLPSTTAALEEVRGLLLARIKQRNPTFVVRQSRLRRRGGVEGIELVGRQTIAGLRYYVRSTHLFKAAAEVVIDAYAPPAEFVRVDRTVFGPVLRSLKVTEP